MRTRTSVEGLITLDIEDLVAKILLLYEEGGGQSGPFVIDGDTLRY
jgi:hypothetical protein